MSNYPAAATENRRRFPFSDPGYFHTLSPGFNPAVLMEADQACRRDTVRNELVRRHVPRRRSQQVESLFVPQTDQRKRHRPLIYTSVGVICYLRFSSAGVGCCVCVCFMAILHF